MVYAPADGLVVGGSYLWSTQVHQVWEIPAISEVVITPADAVNAYTADHTMTVTVLDQDGNPVPNADVTMTAETTEGDAVTTFDLDPAVYTTDENGEVTVVASIEDEPGAPWSSPPQRYLASTARTGAKPTAPPTSTGRWKWTCNTVRVLTLRSVFSVRKTCTSRQASTRL